MPLTRPGHALASHHGRGEREAKNCYWRANSKSLRQCFRRSADCPPAIDICRALAKQGAALQVFDPEGSENAKAVLEGNITFSSNAYEACRDAECLLVATEWSEFRSPDFGKLKDLMKEAVIFDGRNLYEPGKMAALGFKIIGVGRRTS